MSGALLRLEDVRASYGLVEALHGVSLTLEAAEIVAVLGPNGAGKSTLLRSICHAVRTEGRITYKDRRIDRLRGDRIARLGIGHVPEGRGTFVELSVEENLRLGLLSRPRAHRMSAVADMEQILEAFPALASSANRRAGLLSGGQQQMLAIARALLARPEVLLIDEPSIGLAPVVATELFSLLRGLLNSWGLSVLLAEANVGRALSLATRGYVLSSGKILTQGAREALQPSVLRTAYLGESQLQAGVRE